MNLPGGVLHDGSIRRDFRFRDITGEVERVLVDSGQTSVSLPEQVTRILSTSLLEVGGRAADETLARELSCGDRLFLILHLQSLLDNSPKWVTTRCAACDELVQFQITPKQFPVVEAGDAYPAATLHLSVGEMVVRLPNGEDEEAIARGKNGESSPVMQLLSRLLTSRSEVVNPELLTGDDLELIDKRLDEMAPHVGLTVRIDCPHCHASTETELDPYSWLVSKEDALDMEIHTLASHYHWSEKEILQLPKRRRRRYLHIIYRALGKFEAEDFIQRLPGGTM